MRLRRIMIAAPKSGSGKTTITCALLQTLKGRDQQVVSYKCGPDYIDPIFHKNVIDVPSKNLDTFFTGEEETKSLFLKDRTEKDFAVLEGVMGIYDGLGGVREEGSSYHLAKITKTPIILVVDTKGMGRSVISLIAGFLTYDTEHLMKGVILNRISKSYYEMIKPMIEKELDISVLGYLEDRKCFRIESRHLGLMIPDETNHVKTLLRSISEEFQKTVSVNKIIEIAEAAQELEYKNTIAQNKEDGRHTPIIAVAKDEAFCFYYEDNLRMLRENGARLEYFSPLHDKKLPDGCSGLLIGGGYPELYAEALSANKEMHREIRNAWENNMPMVAECGGFMYLHSAIIDKEGKSHAMVGILPDVCYDKGKLVRFGYIELEENNSYFLPKHEKIKGHEFHYFDSENNGSDCLALKPVTHKTYFCVMCDKSYWIGFPHLYYPSNPAFAKSFVEKVKRYSDAK
ncbi:MAG: cobyrinate a,c-diamide synthase [Lachnospiraceae bacterium]|nr:cobyrinate a,c-diamide synthase [Lachnospiraceae bacterium]